MWPGSNSRAPPASTAWCRSSSPTSWRRTRSSTASALCWTSAGARWAARILRSSRDRARSRAASRRSRPRGSSVTPAGRGGRGGWCFAAAPPSPAPPPLPSSAWAKAQTGLPIVTEVMDARDLEPVLEVADVIQIGARNMQNYSLLSEIGRSGCPALLKRGLSSTLEELLMAAEYILKEGNEAVMLCERGIRTFETAYRFTLDLMAVPVLKQMTHLPVIVDPSHAAGRRDLVMPMSLAAAAAGADGIIVEVHPRPDEAICDAAQQLPADEFADFVERVQAAAAVGGKSLWQDPTMTGALR